MAGEKMRRIFPGCALLFCLSCAGTGRAEFGYRIDSGKNMAVITGYTGQPDDVVIPQKLKGFPVREIQDGAFKNKKLASVTFPDTVTYIGSHAFFGNNLTSVTLPRQLAGIGEYAFGQNRLEEITIPESSNKVERFAFEGNPLKRITVEASAMLHTGNRAFDPRLPPYLPQGTYVLDENEEWQWKEADSSLTSPMALYKIQKALSAGAYEAVYWGNAEWLRLYVSSGVNLGAEFWPAFTYRDYHLGLALEPPPARNPDPEIIQLLVKGGAVPQRWMLELTYNRPDITKLLLEYGAFKHDGIPPRGNKRGSLLPYYIYRMAGFDSSSNPPDAVSYLLESFSSRFATNLREAFISEEGRRVTQSAAILLEHLPRPLLLEEYRLLAALDNLEVIYGEDMGWNYDEVILEDIQNGFLDPEAKDSDGMAFVDYAARTTKPGFMERLLPYTNSVNTGLVLQALQTQNYTTAQWLLNNAEPAAPGTDPEGNEYSREYFIYTYEDLLRQGEQLEEGDVFLLSGDRAKTEIEGYLDEIQYSPNAYFTANIVTRDSNRYRNDLTLFTPKGEQYNLEELINAARNSAYAGAGRPNDFNPSWHISRMFGQVLFAYVRVYYDEAAREFVLLDMSGDSIAVYILDTESIKINAQTALYEPYTYINLMDKAMDFVADGGRAYLIRRTGETLVFALDKGFMRFEQTLNYRDCRIPGWKGGERAFVSDDTVIAYNFAAGTGRTLGQHLEIPHYQAGGRNYLYQAPDGRRYIVEGETAVIYPEPAEEYHNFAVFEKGYIYTDNDENFFTVCLYEQGRLSRKLVLSGDAFSQTFSIFGNKIYVGGYGAFTIDLASGKITRAFTVKQPGGNREVMAYMFPFGDNDIIYTYTIDYGK
jgi:hypothetical protein